MAARQRFDTAWQLAVKAVASWVAFEAHGAPVLAAYNRSVSIIQDATSSDEAKQASTPPISNEIGVLAGPLYLAKPDRRRASRVEWTPWWNWWNSGRSRGWAAYEHRLEVARAATADLRKHERVAARRAETARLRRAAA